MILLEPEEDLLPVPEDPPDTALRAVPRIVAVGALSPDLLVAALLFLAPVAYVLFNAFGTLDFETLDVTWGWSLDSFRQVFQQPYLGTVVHSAEFALATVVVCAVPGFAIAHAIVEASGRRRNVLILLVLFPFWTSFIVRTYAWTNLLGPHGVIAGATGLLGHPVVLLGTPTGVLLGMMSAYLPMMVLPIYVALERVPRVLLEAARDLGASDWRILWTVLVPGALPGLAAGALLVGIPASGEYVVPAVLGRGKQLLVGNLISTQMEQNGNYPLGAALTAVLLAALGAALVLVWVSRKVIKTRSVR